MSSSGNSGNSNNWAAFTAGPLAARQAEEQQRAEREQAERERWEAYRHEMEPTGEIPQSPTRTGRDGRTIDTSNIGKQAARAAGPVPASLADPVPIVAAPADPDADADLTDHDPIPGDFMPGPDDLERYAHDPFAFIRDLRLPIPGRPRFGERMVEFQRDAFLALCPTLQALAAGTMPPVSSAWVERTKGSSKDGDVGSMLLWLLAFAPLPLEGRAGASDFDQIDELRKAMLEWLRANPWLRGRVEIQTARAINTATGATLEFLTSDSLGSHGGRPVLSILNELSHMRGDGFALTLMDDADKVSHGVRIICTNAGTRDSWQWDWRQDAIATAETDPSQYVQIVNEVAPWISRKALERARRRNTPSRFARLWQGVWSSGEGDALPSEDIMACLTLDGPIFYPESGNYYLAGLDLGTKRDHSALVVLQAKPGSGRVQLAWVQSWRPSAVSGVVDLVEVQAAVEAAHRRYDLDWVGFDPSQALLMSQQLAAKGLPMREVCFVGKTLNEMARTLIEVVKDHSIDLYDDGGGLLDDLQRLSIEERAFGYKLTSASDERGHADRAIALGICLPLAVEVSRSPVVVNRAAYPMETRIVC